MNKQAVQRAHAAAVAVEKGAAGFQLFHFDRYDTLNAFVETPAEQLVWRRKQLKWTKPWEHDGKVLDLPYQRNYYVIADWMVRWLEQAVGPRYEKWDTYTRCQSTSRNVFFKRRKDALTFVNMIKRELEGIRLSDY